MKVLSVVGARPQFVKLSAIAHEFSAHNVEHVIVHTGQHYDPMLSDVFFRDLGIPEPDEHLGVGSGGHGAQTGAILAALDDILLKHQPDWVLVYGDTNSTIAAALSAVKLHFRVAHLEAGLRSFNRRMPEEHNRVLTDHASDLCLAPTDAAVRQLSREGLGEISMNVGDVMVDVLYGVRDLLRRKPVMTVDSPYVATIHRPDNTDDPDRLRSIIESLRTLDSRVVLYAHPRLLAKAADAEIELSGGGIELAEPAAYPDLVAAVLSSRGVITDSGGLQKEAFLLRIPCTTIRPETEWTETVDLGWNVLANDPKQLRAAVTRTAPQPTSEEPYGSGNAARLVRIALEQHLR